MILFAAAVIALLSWAASYFPGWFDSGEFAAAIFSLGVPHPTGHPTYLLSAQPFVLLPLGSVAFRTALVSIASAACAMLAMSNVATLVTKTSKQWTAWGAIAVLFFPSIALQLTRTEVYATQFAFSWFILLALLRANEKADERWNGVAAFLGGLTFALQPLLTLVLLPLFLTIRPRRWPMVFLLFVLGYATNLYIPLRAATNPVINWDDPSTFKAWVKFMQARDFQVFFHPPVSAAGIRDWKSAGVLDLFPLVLLAPLLIGLGVILKSVKQRSHQILALAFFFSWIPWLTKDFHLQNPDSHAYVMWPISLSVLLAAVGVRRLAALSMPLGKACGLLIVVLLFPTWEMGYQGLSAHGGQAADALSRHLDHAAPKSALIVDSDHWIFPLWYRSYVEGRRPDVAILANGLGNSSWYVAQVTKRYEDLFTRSAIKEQTRPATAKLYGYLFGNRYHAHLKGEFQEECLKATTETDPFAIERSICAHVVKTTAVALANDLEGVGCATRLLEVWLREPTSNVGCWPMKSFSVLQPLSTETNFLTDPRTPVSLLARFYLGCNREDMAQSLLSRREGDANADLLRSAQTTH